jgi:nucleotide-binding universal stress UspA family protein
MRRVIAAVDDSQAASTVAAEAAVIGTLFGATVDVVTVREPGREPERLRGVELQVLEGPVTPALARVTAAADVVALVIGAGMRRHGAALGHQSRHLITVVRIPVVVVAADAEVRPIRRILVPLDGTSVTATAMRSVTDLSEHSSAHIVAVHVHSPETVPMFSDQPHHEAEAWGSEFLRRHWGAAPRRPDLRIRMGDPAEEIVAIAAEERADLMVLGWSRDLSHGRAQVVKAALDIGRIPVLLVAVAGESTTPKAVASLATRQPLERRVRGTG